MPWEARLRDLLLAGGTLAAAVACTTGDGGGVNIPCGNANPDPCICGRPEAGAMAAKSCADEMACQAAGGVYSPAFVADGALGSCSFPDAGAHD